MATDPLKLQALTQVAIRAATDQFLAGGSVEAWEQAMRATLARGHTAAYLAGLAERLGVPLDTALVSERRLSRAERAEIKRAVADQLRFLDSFVADVRDGTLSEAQVRARADMYAGATRGTFSGVRWGDWELPFHPTEGSECMSNCRCSWAVEDNGDGTGSAVWKMGGTERHCTTCPARASDSPYPVKRRAA